MPRTKETGGHFGGKGKGKGKFFMDDVSHAKAKVPTLSDNHQVNRPQSPDMKAMKKTLSGNEDPHVSITIRSGNNVDTNYTTAPKSPRAHEGRANSASRELPRSSKLNGGKIAPSSGGGKGKTTPLSARKHVVKTGRKFKPGTLALKEIKRL